MTIVTRNAIRHRVIRTMQQFGGTLEEAICAVAQAMHLPPKTVAECLQGEEIAA